MVIGIMPGKDRVEMKKAVNCQGQMSTFCNPTSLSILTAHSIVKNSFNGGRLGLHCTIQDNVNFRISIFTFFKTVVLLQHGGCMTDDVSSKQREQTFQPFRQSGK